MLVGVDFIRAFNIVFDYPDDYLLTVPRKNPSRLVSQKRGRRDSNPQPTSS